MDPVTKEIAARYLKQIEQLGPEKPELLDAALHGTEIIIILCDGRKLRFDTTSPDAPRPTRNLPKPQAGVSEPFDYIEEEVEKVKTEMKPRKGKTKS